MHNSQITIVFSLCFSAAALLAKQPTNLIGLREIVEKFDQIQRIELRGSSLEWAGKNPGRYRWIEFSSADAEVLKLFKEMLQPELWNKMPPDEVETFAAGTILAIDLFLKDGVTRRRMIYISGQLDLASEAWIDPDDIPENFGHRLVALLSKPEYRKAVKDISLEEAKKAISSGRKLADVGGFSKIDDSKKWKKWLSSNAEAIGEERP